MRLENKKKQCNLPFSRNQAIEDQNQLQKTSRKRLSLISSTCQIHNQHSALLFPHQSTIPPELEEEKQENINILTGYHETNILLDSFKFKQKITISK